MRGEFLPGADGNYSFTYVPGTLTVGKKALNVTANNQTVTYGTNVPTGTLTAGRPELTLLAAWIRAGANP